MLNDACWPTPGTTIMIAEGFNNTCAFMMDIYLPHLSNARFNAFVRIKWLSLTRTYTQFVILVIVPNTTIQITPSGKECSTYKFKMVSLLYLVRRSIFVVQGISCVKKIYHTMNIFQLWLACNENCQKSIYIWVSLKPWCYGTLPYFWEKCGKITMFLFFCTRIAMSHSYGYDDGIDQCSTKNVFRVTPIVIVSHLSNSSTLPCIK